MKILHTSDWHLGSSCLGHDRSEEFKNTLNWLKTFIKQKEIGAVIISGDVFDVRMPPNDAAQMYYQFLADMYKLNVETVIISGNHDSASYISAPKELLDVINARVVAEAECSEQCVFPLTDKTCKRIVCAVCAVPFLNERNLQIKSEKTEHSERLNETNAAIQKFYNCIADIARQKYPGVPLIMTGHFFASGGKINKTAGNIDSLPMKGMPEESVKYWALGHLHTPQKACGIDCARYSGSLLRMNYFDANQHKNVYVIDTDSDFAIQEIEIPHFKRIIAVQYPSIDEIKQKIEELKKESSEETWIYAVNTGDFYPSLQSELSSLCANSNIVLLASINQSPNPASENIVFDNEKSLKEYDIDEIFEKLLAVKGYDKEKNKEDFENLLEAFKEAKELAAIENIQE